MVPSLALLPRPQGVTLSAPTLHELPLKYVRTSTVVGPSGLHDGWPSSPTGTVEVREIPLSWGK